MRLEFAQVYEEQLATVYGFFAYRLNNRADAEDLTQLTFERALKAWPRYDPRRAAPATWLLSIARNLLIDHFRADRSARHSSLNDDTSGAEGAMPSLSDPLPSLEHSAMLETALAHLSDRDREVVALRFGADMSGAEIAEMTGLTIANVQQILSRSLRRLRGDLEEAGASGPGDL